MNREILFRGRDKDGRWHSGNLIINYDGNCHIWTPYKSPKPLTDGRIYGNLTLVDKETVGQYTGRKDKNGVLIFEDDLIRINGSEMVFLVMFDDYQWMCQRKDIMQYYGHRLENYSDNKYEVAGNIHYNPELLEIGIEKFRKEN